MCDPNDLGVGIVLGQRNESKTYGSSLCKTYGGLLCKIYKYYLDQIIRRCIPESESEVQAILKICHDDACGGHFIISNYGGSLCKTYGGSLCKTYGGLLCKTCKYYLNQ